MDIDIVESKTTTCSIPSFTNTELLSTLHIAPSSAATSRTKHHSSTHEVLPKITFSEEHISDHLSTMSVSPSRLAVSPPNMIYNSLPGSRAATGLARFSSHITTRTSRSTAAFVVESDNTPLCSRTGYGMPGISGSSMLLSATASSPFQKATPTQHSHSTSSNAASWTKAACSTSATRCTRMPSIGIPHGESYPQPSSSPISTSQSHHSSTSTAIPTIHSSQGIKSPIHLVKVNASTESLFYPKSLDGIPVGDFVDFDIVDGLYSLHTTSLGSPCDIINNVGNPNSRNHLYLVTGTEPVWFIACPVLRSCYCDQQIHFALNPGEQKATFMSNIASTTVVMMTTTLPVSPTPRSTVTSVVWVTGG